MDMAKYRALFIEESREHIEALSKSLVVLEAADLQGPIIDEVFRNVHSIKGMAASMGYQPIVNLAHRLEDVVGAKREGRVPREVIDLLLECADALASQIDSIAEEATLEEHVELLKQLSTIASTGQKDASKRATGEVGVAGGESDHHGEAGKERGGG